jgi:hypothetical protein
MDERLHILGIRHHGPGSAALVRQALDAIDPACVLLEGPPEAEPLIPFAAAAGMRPPVALLIYASADANASAFFPYAEFSPEWQVMLWALQRGRPLRMIDWPAGASIRRTMDERKQAQQNPDQEAALTPPRRDPLDALAEAGGYDDGDSLWNALVEQGRASGGGQGVEMLAAVEAAMAEVRAVEAPARGERERWSEERREAWMRTETRRALKEFSGPLVAVVGAWHVSSLRISATATADRALLKDLPREKVEATWVPWTDSRLSAASGYGAGVISPGWYRHLWGLYARNQAPDAGEFAAQWQARTAALLRNEGYPASTAAAIEAARLALALTVLRGRRMPGLEEMRESALAALCSGNLAPLHLVERRLYIGEQVGEIDPSVPQMPLARDLALWQKRTHLKPEDVETEIRVDLRSEIGLLKSTLLHRLLILKVPWGRLVQADQGRGTFRETWRLHWAPELSVALAEALVHGATIESAAEHAHLEQARQSKSIAELADLVRAALVADLPAAAKEAIARLQATAAAVSEIDSMMAAVVPLIGVLRYGTARKLPEEELRALIHALAVEVNAGVRLASHNLDAEASAARVQAMRGFDEALVIFGDACLIEIWRLELGRLVADEQMAAAVSGLALRRLHDARAWDLDAVATAFSLHTLGETPQRAGTFLESFLDGSAEVLLQDQPLLRLIDGWLCSLREEDFVEALPLLRRSLAGFDRVARRRLLECVAHGELSESAAGAPASGDNGAFDRALPLLLEILGIESATGGEP